MKIFLRFLVVISVFLFISCERQHLVNSRSIVDRKTLPKNFARNSSFAVLNMHRKKPLFNKEIHHKFCCLLESKGFYIQDLKDADYFLTFDYKIKDPKNPNSSSKVHELFVNVYDSKMYQLEEKEKIVWKGYASLEDEYFKDYRNTIDYLMVGAFKDFGKKRHSKEYNVFAHDIRSHNITNLSEESKDKNSLEEILSNNFNEMRKAKSVDYLFKQIFIVGICFGLFFFFNYIIKTYRDKE